MNENRQEVDTILAPACRKPKIVASLLNLQVVHLVLAVLEIMINFGTGHIYF